MNNEMKTISPKPVLHGFLLRNGSFVTPAEMEILKSFVGVQTAKN